MTTHRSQAHPLTESELQGVIVRMAEDKGWMVKPHDKANTSAGGGNRRAHRNGSANGFPDLVLARDGEVLFLELKTQVGKLSQEQVDWSMALPSNSGPTGRVAVAYAIEYNEIDRTVVVTERIGRNEYGASQVVARDVPAWFGSVINEVFNGSGVPAHYEVIRPSDLARGRVEELLA